MMDSSADTKNEANERSHLMELPMELHLRIRNQLRKDPDTTMGQLRPLRLVCKTFDAVWSPVVNSNLMLFPGGSDTHVQLRYLVDGKEKGYSAAYTALTIKNMRSVETAADQRRSDASEGLASAVSKQLLIEVSPQVKDAYSVSQAKSHVTSLSHKLNLPNVRHAKLLYDQKETNWSIEQSTRILSSLPQLTELEIRISDDTDVKFLVRCLERLTTLEKLTLLPSKVTAPQVRAIGGLIGRNIHLKHFTCDWKPTRIPSRIEPFRDVPAKKPLKLEHVSLNANCANFEALLPHIRSLSSFEFHSSERNTWCPTFMRAKVFPPTIKVDCLDSEIVSYVGAHDTGIVNFTVTANAVSVDAFTGTIQYPSLFKALVQHTASLRFLFINTRVLPVLLQTAPERMGFLRCVLDLKEIVIVNDRMVADYPDPNRIIQDEKRILPVIALGRTLKLRIRCKDKAIFQRCIDFCRADYSNPLLQDLVGRTVYENLGT